MTDPRARLLIIDPHAGRGSDLYSALRQLHCEVELAGDADDGWRRFAAMRPSAIVCGLGTGAPGGDVFIRRLREQYMGTMPQVYLVCTADYLASAYALEPDAVLVPPISMQAVETIAQGAQQAAGLNASMRMRTLYEVTLLSGDTSRAVDELVDRVSLAFRVSDCAVWFDGDGGQLSPHTLRPRDHDERARLAEECQLALQTKVTTLLAAAPPAGRGAITSAACRSLLALPLQAGDVPIGGIALVEDGVRLYGAAERDGLVLLAKRVAVERAWMSAHERLLDEHERLREQAMVDPLTGVWNRTALEQNIRTHIQSRQRSPKPMSLLVIDITKLAAINDRWGHSVGDGVLIHLAGILAAHSRPDDIIGRVAGDEFCLVIPGADGSGARTAAEHLREAIAASPFLHKDTRIDIAVKFGVAEIPPGETTGGPALARAETALKRRRASADDGDTLPPPAQPAGELEPGSTLGGMYRVLHEISRGAMGVVYRGEDLGLSRPVAIKVLRPDLAADEALVARFRSEAAMLASLHHPNLVQVYTFGTAGQMVYFVMELVEGESLSDLMFRADLTGQQVGRHMVAKMADEVASALEAIHALGIVHRDVKPENVLIDRARDRYVLVDVGVAKKLGGQREAGGTPGYAAPESFMDQDPTPAIDVYGLAATAYAMLTGIAPFGCVDLMPVFERQLHEAPAAPSRLRRGLTPATDGELLKALDPHPGNRHRSAATFAFALGRALEQSSEEDPADLAPPLDQIVESASTARFHLTPAEARVPATGDLECRALFFRSLYQAVGREHGTALLERLVRGDDRLEQLLATQTPALGWLEIGLFCEQLARLTDVFDPTQTARVIGASAYHVGLGQIADAISPGSLDDLVVTSSQLFDRFFRGAELRVGANSDKHIQLWLQPACRTILGCELIGGWLARMAETATGAVCSCDHGHGAGAQPCQFVLGWG